MTSRSRQIRAIALAPWTPALIFTWGMSSGFLDTSLIPLMGVLLAVGYAVLLFAALPAVYALKRLGWLNLGAVVTLGAILGVATMYWAGTMLPSELQPGRGELHWGAFYGVTAALSYGLLAGVRLSATAAQLDMRRLHLAVGIAGVFVFLVTGVYMWMYFPELYRGDEALRFMYRANHVYILLASLVNVVLGVYLAAQRAGWRATFGSVGSGLVILSPLILGLAFVVETPSATPDRALTVLGVFILFIGVLAQLPNNRTLGRG